MKHLLVAVFAFWLLGSGSVARADCVDHSPARAKAAQAEARRKPLMLAELAMPHLNGLERNFDIVGDPKCDGTGPSGPRDRGRYKLTVSFGEFITSLYPNIRRRVETDGMNRAWFRSPMRGDTLFLTSGTQLIFIGGRTGPDGNLTYSEVMIIAPKVPQALVTESQPYTAEDITIGTPWPGGPKGGRQFVRADGVETSAAASPPPAAPPIAAVAPNPGTNPAPAPAAAGTSTDNKPTTAAAAAKPPANCPPPAKAEGDAASARTRGAEVADAVAGKVGGAVGNAAGALGSLLGRDKKPPPAPAKPAGCP